MSNFGDIENTIRFNPREFTALDFSDVLTGSADTELLHKFLQLKTRLDMRHDLIHDCLELLGDILIAMLQPIVPIVEIANFAWKIINRVFRWKSISKETA